MGRPWRPYASITYIHWFIGQHIKPGGWSNWNANENYKMARYPEYENDGPGAAIAARAPWAKQLTDSEEKNISIANVFKGWQPKDCNFKM
ncbi:MAG: pectinesterase family protein [Ginsengibacter sp.]